MKRPSGFTLIELLIVIAIVAILAAILYPVFAQAREKAREVTCLSNMDQIGIAVSMYVQDYDERMFYRAGWANSRSGVIPTENQIRWWNLLMPYIKSNNVFNCPSDNDPTKSPNASGNLTIERSYIAVCMAESLTLARIDDPVETMVVTEKWNSDYACNYVPGCVGDSWIEPFNGDFGPDAKTPTKMWTASNRHQGLINCTFFDGHAKALTQGDIETSKDLTGCNLLFYNSFKGVNPPTVYTLSSAPGQPNVCTPTPQNGFTYP